MPRIEENVPHKMLRILRIKIVESKCSRKLTKYYFILYFGIYLLDLSGLGHDNIQIYLHSVHIYLLLNHNCEGGEWCVLCNEAYDMLHDT